MKAILNVGTHHDLYNKVVEVELTGHQGLHGILEAITIEEHELHYDLLRYAKGKLVETIPTTSTQRVTAWIKEIIEEEAK